MVRRQEIGDGAAALERRALTPRPCFRVPISAEIWRVKLVRSCSTTRAEAAWFAFAACPQAALGHLISKIESAVSQPAALSYDLRSISPRVSLVVFRERPHRRAP